MLDSRTLASACGVKLKDKTMTELLIKKIEPIGGDPESASVTLSNGENEIVVFCHPCWYEVGQFVPNLLNALDAEKLQSPYGEDWPIEEKETLSEEKLELINNWSYKGCGKVVDQSNGIFCVKGFNINVGELPCYGHVEFIINRIDLY